MMQDPIDRLNDRVRQLVKQKTGPEIDYILKNGVNVYHHRFRFLVYGISICSGLVFFHSLTQINPWAVVLIFGFMWIYGDFLHIVLDNPANIVFPLIGPGALEFQFHHLIPTDIVTKPYVEVLGDLNTPVLATLAFLFFTSPLNDPLFQFILTCKIFNAYFGQWSHKMAHTMKNQRPRWVKWCQESGILLKSDEHWIHHAAYTSNFAINNGITTPIFAKLLKITMFSHESNLNRWIWLFLFLFMTMFDVIIFYQYFKVLFG